MKTAAVFLLLSSLARGALEITNARAGQTEDGPTLPTGTEFVPGETLFYSFQVAGYTAVPEKPPISKIRLNYRIDAFDPKGIKLIETVESVLDTTLAEQDKKWKPKIRAEILIPPYAPGGKYRIAATVTDDISKQSATSDTPFEVGGRTVERSPELTVRNFGFYRSEDDTRPLSLTAYRPGETLFAHFDIAGFRYGDRNMLDVSYDVAVRDSQNKTIYSQTQAAVEKSFSFYPKPFVPGGLSLSLQPNMRLGEYTILLTVHDTIGHQDHESSHTFRVE